jgi:alpha-beta hydrolase superfamily lysophospholipase
MVSAPYYELSAAEIWERAAPANHIARARVPVLVLHPEDDMIIKSDQAEILRDAAAGNDLVRVWLLPAGRHGILDAIDHDWTYAAYRTFFERWAEYPDRAAAEVVYSPGADGYAERATAGRES